MSIASRITAMTEHIDDIYDTVELTGVDTTGVNKNLVNVPNTLKDGFVDIINNGVDTLYENFPKVSQTGEEPTLNGVYEAPMRVDLNGNTEQDSYSGKNLLAYTLAGLKTLNILGTWNDNVYSYNGVDYTINEDLTIKVNGTASGASYLIINNDLSLTNGTDYILNGCPTGGGVSTYAIRLYTGNNYVSQTGLDFPFTYESQNLVRINVFSGTSLNNLVFKPMIRLASVTDDTYEPFVGGSPSPSPDFPQDIRVVKGNNTIKVTGKNLFDKNNVVTGVLNADGTIGTGSYITTDFIKINSSKTYTKNISGSRRIKFYDKDKNVISTESYSDIADFNVGITFTIPYSNAVYIRYTLSTDNVETNQLEEGSTATEYQPYQETTYPLNLGNIELCKIGDYKDYIYKENDKWYLKKNIGKVVLDGSEDESWSYNSGNEVFVSSDLVNYMLVTFTPFCNYYTGKPSITGYSQIPNNCIAFLNSSTNNRLVVKNTTYNTASNFKTWLSNHNTTVYYVLATPTTTEITDTSLIEQLEALKTAKSVEGQTNITQTNEELPFILDVSGLKKD